MIDRNIGQNLNPNAIKQLKSYVTELVKMNPYKPKPQSHQIGRLRLSDIIPDEALVKIPDDLQNKILALLKDFDFITPGDFRHFFSTRLIHLQKAACGSLEEVSSSAKDSDSEMYLADRLLSELLNFPVEYEVLIPIMNSDYWEDFPAEPIEICQNTKLLLMSEDMATSTYFLESEESQDFSHPLVGFIYVSFFLDGLLRCDETSYVMKSAVRLLRYLITALAVKEIIAIDGIEHPYEEAYSGWGPNYYYVYPRSSDVRATYGKLPLPERHVLHCLNEFISIHSEFEQRLTEKLQSLEVAQSKYRRLRSSCKGIDMLIPSALSKPEKLSFDVLRIITALDWFFDASSNENLTFSFVQYAIALETLFGEKREAKDIADRLSDRCAFLVARHPEERRKIKADLKTAYDIRSRIIHQGNANLKDKDLMYYGILRDCLGKALAREIDSLPLVLQEP